MKKVFVFFAVAALFAACAPKQAEKAVTQEDSVVTVQPVANDTLKTDSLAKVDSVAPKM